MWPVGRCEAASASSPADGTLLPGEAIQGVPQGHSSSSSKPGVLSSFGSRPRLFKGASRLPLLREARPGRPAELPDSPSVLIKTPQSQCPTHLTRDGRPTGSTCPPWPRPMGAPGVAGVGGSAGGGRPPGGNQAAGARARVCINCAQPARGRAAAAFPACGRGRRSTPGHGLPVTWPPSPRRGGGLRRAWLSTAGGSDPDRDRGPAPHSQWPRARRRGLKSVTAVRSSHGGSVFPSSQLPSLAPHGPRHRPAFAAAQPNGGACGPAGLGVCTASPRAPAGLDSESRALVPKGSSGWNPGATAVEGPPNRRRQRAWRSPGPSPCPLRARTTIRLPVARLTIVIPSELIAHIIGKQRHAFQNPAFHRVLRS
jgi:hypothetical protein